MEISVILILILIPLYVIGLIRKGLIHPDPDDPEILSVDGFLEHGRRHLDHVVSRRKIPGLLKIWVPFYLVCTVCVSVPFLP